MSIDMLRTILAKRGNGRSYIRADEIVDYICNQTGLERDIVLAELSTLKASGEIVCADWHRGEPLGQLHLKLKQSMPPSVQRWRKVLEAEGLSSSCVDALDPMASSLEEWNVSDLHRLCVGLVSLRADMPTLGNESRYRVSARYLLGSSKLLDALPTASLRAFGIEPSRLSGPPGYVVTAGPSNPKCVVLVENPQAFEVALEAEQAKEIAWVATFGYGLSHSGNDFGRQLAAFVEDQRRMVSLVRKGTPPDICQLLLHPTIYFWGDMDREGFKIYWRLKARIKQLQLSALYTPMIDMVRQDQAHPYVRLVSKEAQECWVCEDPSVAFMLKVCEEKAVDQEALSIEKVRQYACHSFELS